MGSVRVLFDPSPTPDGERTPSVVRARLRLSAEGPRKTLVTRAPQPATLTFLLTLIEKVREGGERTERPWFTLAGQLRLRKADSSPVLVLSEEPVAFDAPDVASGATESGRPRQFLFLDFDEDSFAGAASLKVPLPDWDGEVRHIEARVELRVAEATESAADFNDVLDKPLGRQSLDVNPVLVLDTPVEDPAEHNLAFQATIPNDAFEVARLTIGGEELVEGESFFQGRGHAYFRPASKLPGLTKGTLETTDGRFFEFTLRPAETLNQRMNSLSAQLDNATRMADVAAERVLARGGDAGGASAVRDRLLSEAFARKVALLDSIEGTLGSDHEFAAFHARAAGLPSVLDGIDDEEGELV